MKLKTKNLVTVFTALLLFTGVAVAQDGPQQIPHIVDGESIQVQGGPFDSDGEPYSGTVVASSGVSDPVSLEDGSFQDLLVTGLSSGDEFGLTVGDVQVDSSSVNSLPIEFESGKTTTVEESITVEVDELNADLSVSSTDVDSDERVEFDFDGSGSTGVTDYELDLDDGTTESFNSSSTFDYTYSDDGSYEVSLTVYDEVGNTASDTATVNVGTSDSGSDSGDSQEDDSSTGGGTLPPSDDEPEPKSVDAEVNQETGQASAQVDNVEENQQVQVNIPDTEEAEFTVEQVSFTSSSSSDSVSVSVSDLGTDRPEEVSEDAGTDVYSYQQIDVEGVEDEDITESSVNFKVQKSFLDERDRSPEDVVMKRYNDNQWQELDTRIDEELENAYRFEASSTGFSYYAIALRDQKQNETQGEPNIQTSSLNVEPTEGTPPFDVTIEATVENTGDASGTHEVEITLNGEVIKSETVSLEAGEERTLSYNYTVEQSGSLSFSAGNQSTTVEASQTSNLPVLPLVALLIVAILAVVGYTQRETIQDKVEDLRE